MCTLAAADPAQLLFVLPRLLDLSQDPAAPPHDLLQTIAAELRALAAAYGTAVVSLRLLQLPAPPEEGAEPGKGCDPR